MRGKGGGADFASGDIGPATKAIGIIEEQIALGIAWADNYQAHLLGIVGVEQGREDMKRVICRIILYYNSVKCGSHPANLLEKKSLMWYDII